jgi:expansin
VNEGSTSFWLSLLVEFEDGDGDIGSMQLEQVRNSVLSRYFIPV